MTGCRRCGAAQGCRRARALTTTTRVITPSESPWQLLTLLALERDGLRRTAATDTLWRDAPPDSNALATNISRLLRLVRQETNGAITDLFLTPPGKCALNPNIITVDYWDLLDALALPHTINPTQRAAAYLKGSRA